jgi:hypothetical protein
MTGGHHTAPTLASADATTVNEARRSASASAAAGAPWLIAYALTLTVVAALSFVLDTRTVALATLFQGGVALPLAFALERRLGQGTMATDHPLRSLSVQLAMVQIVALPAVIMLYPGHPELVPAALAAIGGAHFLPYVWLHETRIYLVLAIAVSLVSWVLCGVFEADAHRAVLVWWAACYVVAAAALLQLARRRTAAA